MPGQHSKEESLPLTFPQMAQEPGLKIGQPIRYGEGVRVERREPRGERGGEGIGKTGAVLTNNRSGNNEG